MQNDFDSSTVPYSFLHCVNSRCVKADTCLRHQVMAYITPERENIPIVNPVRIPDDGKDCTYFFSEHKSQFALGITHLLDDIPYRTAVQIKREMFSYFNRTTYYRVLHKERLISPAEQQFIRQLFINKEINTEPVYDRYVEQYE